MLWNGAAAYSGAVTHTLSTALLVFELTGQMSHVLPLLIAVLVANGLSQRLRPPSSTASSSPSSCPTCPSWAAHDIYAEDFMVTDLQFLPRGCRYKDLRGLLKASSLKQFPLVDSKSRILLGSVRRKHLAKLLSEQLSAESDSSICSGGPRRAAPHSPLLGADGASGTPEEKQKHREFLLSRATGETSKEE
ncbi:unnamed protein product, partial [Lepidochelys kempii]